MKIKTGIYFFVLTVMFFLAGCSVNTSGRQEGASGKQDSLSEQEKGFSPYIIHEITIPNPDAALADKLPEGAWINGTKYQLWKDTLYRIAEVRQNAENTEVVRAQYLQELKPPYESWQSHEFNVSGREEGKTYFMDELQVTEKGKMYVSLYCPEDGTKYIGEWKENTCELCCQIPETIVGSSFFADGERIYRYTRAGTDLDVSEGMQSSRQVLAGQIYGLLKNPNDDKLVWYGKDLYGAAVYGVEGKERIIDAKETVNSYEYYADYAETGELFLVDADGLWCCAPNPRQLFYFADKDYLPDKIGGIGVQDKENILLLAEYEGGTYLLQIEENEEAAEKNDKQEMILSIEESSSGLRRAVMKFNRQSNNYHITIQTRDKGEEREDYITRLQMEITAGKGPDILADWFLDIEAYARNGYIQSLEGVINEKDAFVQGALECGMIDGITYGIPFDFSFFFAVFSKDLTQGRDTWTLSEMMEAVRASDAQIFAQEITGMEIVWYCGMVDNDNKELIDWETGESHLTEKPFLELLAFAKEYEDDGRFRTEEIGEMQKQGAYAAEIFGLSNLQGLNYLEARFQGEEDCIGFPRSTGNGIYVDAAPCLYLNAASDKREGFEEFVHFLTSEKIQNEYASYRMNPYSSVDGYSVRFPLRLSALEDNLLLEMQEKSNVEQKQTATGLVYYEDALNEEQVRQFRRLVNKAYPDRWYAADLINILFEELQPYFDDVKTAEEAAEALDNRVQLYLDERN